MSKVAKYLIVFAGAVLIVLSLLYIVLDRRDGDKSSVRDEVPPREDPKLHLEIPADTKF
jgi:hypothetical protein